MKIQPISKMKSQSLNIDENLIKDLEKYAEFLSQKEGGEYETSDIVSALLLDQKAMKNIPKEEAQKKVNLRLPTLAWKNLDESAQATGLKREKVLKEVASNLLRNKEYIGWKKGIKEARK